MSLDNLYLILHKVRGEPALDIAILMNEGSPFESWIIPTSGHRAHPLDFLPIERLYTDDGLQLLPRLQLIEFPHDWLDHYHYHNQPKPKAQLKVVPRRETSIDDLLDL